MLASGTACGGRTSRDRPRPSNVPGPGYPRGRARDALASAPPAMSSRSSLTPTLCLMLAAALGAGADASPQAPRQLPGVGLRTLLGRPGGNPRSMSPQQLRTSQATTAWLTSIAAQALAAPVFIPGVGGTAYVLKLFVPQTGNEELFTLHVPDSPAGQARPLLVGFHSYGVSHLDFSYYNTSFLSEADARDWFVLAPIQINPLVFNGNGVPTGDLSYGAAESQLNVEAVMDYVLSHWPIDRDRVYGVGFSMGGGNALSYGARHRNRDEGAFAAIVNHTGAVNGGVVWNEEPGIQAPLETTFGGPPPRFEYQRASLIDVSLGPAADYSLIPDGRHMAANLVGVPVRTYYYAGDPLVYLRTLSDRLDTFMSGDPTLSHELFVELTPPCPGNSNSPNHCWELLDEASVCDWLAQQALGSYPLRGKVLADRDERWNGLQLQQRVVGSFSALEYDLIPGSSGQPDLILTGRENLSRIGLDLEDFNLDASVGLQLVTDAIDGAPVDLVVQGAPLRPTLVLRNSLQVSEDCSGATAGPRWCHDRVTGTLELHEPDGSVGQWSITF